MQARDRDSQDYPQVVTSSPWLGKTSFRARGNTQDRATALANNWSNYLYLPHRPIDAICNSGLWVSSVSFITSITLVLPVVLQVGIMFAVLVLLYTAVSTVAENEKLRTMLQYRILLALIGVLIGVIL